MIDPMTLAMLAGTASSLIGGNRMSGEQRRQLQLQNNIAGRLYAEGTGVPGSDPQEQAALASQQAQLGEQQLNQRNQAYAALGANQGTSGLGDFLSNLGSQQTAQNMSLSSQHLMNALAMRRQALLQASGVGMSAAQLAQNQGPPNQLPAMFGQLAQSLAYNQAMKQGQPKTGGGGGAGLADLGLTTADLARTMPGASTQAFVPMAQQGWSLPNQGGLIASGNEPGGWNSQLNINRQSNGLGDPLADLGTKIRRRFMTPGGLQFG